MSVKIKGPGYVLVGFLVIGGINSLSNTFTGSYLFGGGSDDSAQATSAEAPAEVNADGWTHPTSGKTSTAYGIEGDMWISGHHTGVDFPVATGTRINAAADGTVVTAGPGGQYGNQIVIRHQDKLYSQYAHLSRIDVAPGDTVTAGEQIGLSGASGNATGPHLHFEVRTGPKYGSDINPMKFL